MKQRFSWIVGSALVSALVFTASAAAAPLLLRNPSLAAERVAFLYANDVWTVARQGGEARRLTASGDVVAGPSYSPDGKQIAYSVRTQGMTNLYVTDAEGGVPRRLTWLPSAGAQVVGWTQDSREVLYSSARMSKSAYHMLFRVRADGRGPAQPLPLPSADWGSFSPDGSTLAYLPVNQWQAAWKHYRGGQTTPIWLVNLHSLDIEKIPRDNSNDSHPVWIGSTVYFLSDRNGPVTLFSYDSRSHQVQQLLDNPGFDLKTLSAGPGGLVYEQFGSLHFYDVASHKDSPLEITVRGDLPALTPHIANLPPRELQNMEISPTGARMVAEVGGEIFTLPVDKGDTRNLTRTPRRG